MNYTTKIRTGTVGPRNSPDPYGYEEITIRSDDKVATLYTDGLGENRFTLTDRDGMVLRREEWFDSNTQAATIRLRVDLLCKRHVGVSFSTVQAEEYGLV